MGNGERVRVSDRVSELEVKVTDPTVPCVAATAELGGRFELEEIIPRSDGSYAEYYSIEDIDLDRLLEYAEAHDASEAQLLSQQDDQGLLEMIVTADCPAMTLAEMGALPRSVSAAHGVLRIVAELPPQYDESAVTEQFFGAYPDAELVGKRNKSYFTPLFSHRQLDQALDEYLTERQREVLELASQRGYYEWPREITQEELAEELGITTSTFTQHLRTAEQTLITMVFNDERRSQTASSVSHQA